MKNTSQLQWQLLALLSLGEVIISEDSLLYILNTSLVVGSEVLDMLNFLILLGD